ncbi:MAG: SUMF1/EgtB/PvdO family nonheme iron enzyme [Treponemataceae bacterium]
MKKILYACFGFVIASLCSIDICAQDSPLLRLRESMVLVEGGTFLRGSAEQPYAATERVHQTTVSSFRVASTETTQGLWRTVMGTNPSAFKGDNRPVEKVSWLDAIRFCNALSVKEGLQEAYDIVGANVAWIREADGYRLPTEAEWEYAARGGRYGASGAEPLKKAPYSGGTEPNAVAWYDGNSGKTTQNVAGKAANQLGLYDMSGNVWEWCWDWYGAYPRDSVVDPEGVSSEAGQKVLRGGAWFAPVNLLRATYRYWNAPTFKVNSVGFRVARNAAPYRLEATAKIDFFQALSAP